MNTLQTLAAPAGRVLLATLFLLAGLQKIGGYDGTLAYMASQGVPGFTLPLVIALEVLGALAIIVGWQTRLVALLLAGFSIASGLLFHFKPDDAMQMTMLLKNLAIAGGFLLLVAHGAGAWSVDGRRRG
ncbi:DoxX family protein [Panacagrimonas sp.]|uniref:DoxX family protein n=1 Tax=Panacagrimonas sp. TaxID=2480088 RepID=UPI003B51B078